MQTQIEALRHAWMATAKRRSAMECPPTIRLSPCNHFSREHEGIPGSGVPHRAPKFDFGKTNRAKLIQEGTAFLRAAHSGEPV